MSTDFCSCPGLADVPAKAILSENCPLCGKIYSLRAWIRADKRIVRPAVSIPREVVPVKAVGGSRRARPYSKEKIHGKR